MTTEELIKALREKPSRDNRALLDEAAERLEEQEAKIERLKAPKFIIEQKPLSEKEMREALKYAPYGVISNNEVTIKRIDEEGIKAEAIEEIANEIKRYFSEWCAMEHMMHHCYKTVADYIDSLVREAKGGTIKGRKRR